MIAATAPDGLIVRRRAELCRPSILMDFVRRCALARVHFNYLPRSGAGYADQRDRSA
jgi:hypothetical protein